MLLSAVIHITFGLQHSKCQVREVYTCASQTNNAGSRTNGQLNARTKPSMQNRN